MGVNAYFVPRKTNITHATPNYGPGKYMFNIDNYRQIYCFQKNYLIYEESWKKQVKNIFILQKIQL